MRLLLHICCAPCAIYPLEELRGEGFDSITGFFYNPNIHPYTEYIRRKTALEEYSGRHDLPVIFRDYNLTDYFRGVAQNEEAPARCRLCWRMRLNESALFGSRNGYDAFTTTLLVSPYQDHDLIKEIGREAAENCGIDFIYREFRKGFRKAQDDARREGLYRQKYCGCIFSERERYEEHKTKKSPPSPYNLSATRRLWRSHLRHATCYLLGGFGAPTEALKLLAGCGAKVGPP